MRHDFTEADEGKKVLHDNETVGRIVDVDHGTAYVDADPGITEKVLSKLGWADNDGDETYPLQETMVDRVEDDAVYLESQI